MVQYDTKQYIAIQYGII